MPSSGMLRLVALVRTDVSEERSVSIIRVTRIGELGKGLAATSNRRTLPRNSHRNTHGISSQKTAFVIVTAMKSPNLTNVVPSKNPSHKSEEHEVDELGD
jgi:hypothetical protein